LTATFGFLSTHPPTVCGLATFNAALATHIDGTENRTGVVRVITGTEDQRARPDVVHTWSHRSVGGWREAARALSGFDVAVIQHEYGIYPGPDGSDVLLLLRRLTMPSIVVLHTVLATPTLRQRALLEQIVGAASAVVTLTATARDRLLAGYAVDTDKVTIIPHGTADHASTPTLPHSRPHLLTWGLLGPGKGIEWGLRALAHLQDLENRPTYTIAGRTHPKVLASHGDAYRNGLRRLGENLGVAADVEYDPVYRGQAELSRLIRRADVVLLPYDSREQVTSGVLVEAVAAGVPVVATCFPHAVELLTDGPGLLVPHQDAAALAAAIRRILTESGLITHLVGRTRDRPTLWPAVAARYVELGDRLLSAGTRGLATATR
jgi:glycosyltransferase involved in cell wall biosynthesis